MKAIARELSSLAASRPGQGAVQPAHGKRRSSPPVHSGERWLEVQPSSRIAGEKLAALEPGGAPDRPIDVPSASTVEVHAKSEPCLRCGGACRVAEHTAETLDEKRLRVVTLACAQCGARRALFFRILQPSLN